MAAKLARLTNKMAIQLHLVAESCTICSSRSRRPLRKLLDTPSYTSFVRPRFSLSRKSCNGLHSFKQSYFLSKHSLSHN
jgi:hypothetical protein